ncbi:MAG TPA: hypothetical protein DCP14_03880 [Rhodobiaceae bacterium]|nr:hypothetical protein [Rhodobiaceae bacterium]
MFVVWLISIPFFLNIAPKHTFFGASRNGELQAAREVKPKSFEEGRGLKIDKIAEGLRRRSQRENRHFFYFLALGFDGTCKSILKSF